MALPLPYAPNIDVDAERLRSARAEAARPAMDVGAGVAQAISGGIAMAKAIEDGNKKEAAALFQKEYLDKGNEGILQAYKEAGEPKDFPIQAYLMPAGTPADKAREGAIFAIKNLTDYKEKADSKKAVTEFADITTKGVANPDGTFRPATEAERSAAEIKARGAEGVKSVQDRADATVKAKDRSTTAEKVANIRADATKANATAREALANAKDASVVAAIEREQQIKEDKMAEIDATEENPDLSEGAKRRKIDRLSREMSASDTRISGYITKVSDVSKVPDGIKKRDPAATTDTEVETARGAIKMGAPAASVYDRYKANTGKRHPDDTRK